jgi:hypothetical protein
VLERALCVIEIAASSEVVDRPEAVELADDTAARKRAIQDIMAVWAA